MKSASAASVTPKPLHTWPSFDGVRLAGDTWGHPDGAPVVLLHGGGQTRHAWGGTGERLGRAGYFAVAYDARGHGDSGWSAHGDYSLDALAADLDCVLAALDIRRPALIGASVGGATSLVAIAEKQVNASALILVDIVPYSEPAGVDRIRAFMTQHPDGFGSLDEVADAIADYRPSQARRRNLGGLAKNVRLGDDGRYRWHWDPKFLARPMEPHARHARLADSARRLALPTLLVRGGSSDIVSEAGVKEFIELCPQAAYVNIEQAGHMVAGDRNDLFGDAAIDFLARQGGVAGNPGSM